MSRTIEREVTALSFDAREFKSGIDGALRDIDRMQKGLKFDGAVKGFAELDKSSKKVDFNPLGKSIESVTARLSTMGVIGATIVNRLTNSIIDATTSMFKALVTNPLKMGLEEYETQINAIQTILSNTRTKGTVLEDVTVALDELNKYADLTIYNFTEMTKNIGTFTAAGVDLDTSVGAIKGIANLAAVSGSSSQQASVAMYQLSQAISSGTVKLMDWNSVVNAGMGGELFKQLLIDFGEVNGQIEKGAVTTDMFRESLQDGWLTADVLLGALQAMAGELDHLDLTEMGFSDQEAANILAMAKDAEAAATEIKTATQLVDVAIEAMQSGWSQTWRMLIGDFNQAKEVFGSIGDIMTGAIEASAEARNRFFNVFVVRGGRDLVIDTIKNAMEALLNIVGLFKSATADVFAPFKGYQLFNIVKGIADFVERVKMASESGERFKSIIRGLASILDIVKMFILALLGPIFELKDGALDTADGLLDLVAAAGDWLFNLRNVIKDTDVFGNAINNLRGYIRQGITTFRGWIDAFLQLEPVKDIIAILQRIDKSDFVRVFDAFKQVLLGIAYVIGGVVLGIKGILKGIASLTPVRKVLDYLSGLTYDDFKALLSTMAAQIPVIRGGIVRFGESLSDIGGRVKDFITNFKESKAVQSFVDYINSMDGSRIKGFFADLKLNFDWVPGALGSIKELLGGLREALANLLPDASELGESVGGAFSSIFDYVGSDDINFVGLANVLTAGLVTAIAVGLKNLLQGGFITDIIDKYIGESSPLVSSITNTFGALQDTLTSWQNNLKADTITKIAVAIGVVAASALALSLIDQNKLAGAVIAMGALMTELFGGAAVISKLSYRGLSSATIAVVGLAAGLLILALALKAFNTMDEDELQKGLTVAGIAIAGFVVAIKGLSIGPLQGGMIKSAIAFGVLSGAMLIFAVAMREMGTIPYDVATDGLIRMGAALAGFVAFSKLVSSNEAILTAIAIGGLGGAIVILAKGIEEIGKLSWEELLRGLAGLAGSLLILAGGVKLMTGALPGAAAILVLSGAMFVLAQAMRVLGELTWEGIIKSLVALAGVFLVFGVAGYLLGPVVPILLGLAAAMALIGLAALGLGVGIGLAATGLVLLAGSAAAVAAAIAVVGGAVILILPKLAEAIALAIASFFQTLSDNGPKLFEAGVELLLGLIDSVTEVTPYIVESLLVMIQTFLDLLVEHIPNFVETGFELLLGILKGIEDNIEDVVETAVGIATKFIEGLTDSIPDLVDAGFEFVSALVQAIIDATIEHGGDLYGQAWAAATNVINGFIEGVMAGIDAVIDAAKQLAQAAVDAWNDLWDNRSPSHLAQRLSRYVTSGFALGLDDGADDVVGSISRLGQKAQNGMNRIIDQMHDSINTNLDMTPVITPVLDMGAINGDLNSLNRSLSRTSYVSAIASELRRGAGRDSVREAVETPLTKDSAESTVIFEQNNYSPKALSTIDIYRKTKTQLARLERRKLA